MWIKLSHTLFWKGIKLSRDKNNGSCISQAEAANMEKLDSAGKLTLSWWRPLSYRNQSIDLWIKSMDWFLYDNGLRHERVNRISRSEFEKRSM